MTNEEMLERIVKARNLLERAWQAARRNKAAADLITETALECSAIEIGLRQRKQPRKAAQP